MRAFCNRHIHWHDKSRSSALFLDFINVATSFSDELFTHLLVSFFVLFIASLSETINSIGMSRSVLTLSNA
jgi:hypothetical protein